jgi:hypothetical protein
LVAFACLSRTEYYKFLLKEAEVYDTCAKPLAKKWMNTFAAGNDEDGRARRDYLIDDFNRCAAKMP